MFHVRLLERLSTQSSHAGESFEMIAVASVRAADGAQVVPTGGTVRGHVVTANPVTSTLRIKFDSIETERGPQPLHATLAPVQLDPALGATSFTGPGREYDIAIGPVPPGNLLEVGTEGVPPSTGPNPGGEATLGGSAVREPQEIALEVDSTLQLLLTAPLGVGD